MDYATADVGGVVVRLRQQQLKKLLEFSASLAGVRSVDDCSRKVVEGLQRLIPCEHVSYSELPLAASGPRFVIVPAEATTNIARELEAFRRYSCEHPVLAHYQKTAGDVGWLRITDFVTKRQFRRTALYNEFYRRVGTQAQILVIIPSSRASDIALGVNRTTGDFSETERSALNLLRSGLESAFTRAEATERVERSLAAIMAATATVRVGVAVVENYRIVVSNEAAEAFLRDYFGFSPANRQAPVEIVGWLVAHKTGTSDRLVKSAGERKLSIRAVAAGRQTTLLMEEASTIVAARSLRRLGLTNRESEVLVWVSEGKTNPEIGMILGVSPRTVQHHLEAIYRKLGVETRTAAAARALEVSAARLSA